MPIRTLGGRFLHILVSFSFLFAINSFLSAQESSLEMVLNEGSNAPSEGLSELLSDEKPDGQLNGQLDGQSNSDAASSGAETVVAHYVEVFAPQEGEAPLAAPTRWAKEGSRNIETNIHDYSCTVLKRERINGILGRQELIEAKVRHEPFSVYMRFEQPRRFCGREVIFTENCPELLVHGVGFEALAGTLHLEPEGRLAMKGNLHPITEFGILNLARMLAKVGDENLLKGNYEVHYFDVKIEERDCVCVEVVNTDRAKDPSFYKAHVYVDMDLNIPVKFMSWGWGNGRDFPLMEEYIYTNIQLNRGFTDQDFSVCNPEYNFKESRN